MAMLKARECVFIAVRRSLVRYCAVSWVPWRFESDVVALREGLVEELGISCGISVNHFVVHVFMLYVVVPFRFRISSCRLRPHEGRQYRIRPSGAKGRREKRLCLQQPCFSTGGYQREVALALPSDRKTLESGFPFQGQLYGQRTRHE